MRLSIPSSQVKQRIESSTTSETGFMRQDSPIVYSRYACRLDDRYFSFVVGELLHKSIRTLKVVTIREFINSHRRVKVEFTFKICD